jgi:hypothetical protein
MVKVEVTTLLRNIIERSTDGKGWRAPSTKKNSEMYQVWPLGACLYSGGMIPETAIVKGTCSEKLVQKSFELRDDLTRVQDAPAVSTHLDIRSSCFLYNDHSSFHIHYC